MLGAKVFAVVLLIGAASAQTTPSVYEDDEVRITIPPSWSHATGNYPSIEPYRVDGTVVLGNSVSQAPAKLFLQKGGYTLALAYRTGHASGVEGGRFIEAFNIPWLKPDQAWGPCSGVLAYIPQAASRTLLFQNIVFETGSSKVRAQCGLPKQMGESIGEGLRRRFIGERRWYGGYFTDHAGNGSGGGFFFDNNTTKAANRNSIRSQRRPKGPSSSRQSKTPGWNRSFKRRLTS
jgi:hypothetical protein